RDGQPDEARAPGVPGLVPRPRRGHRQVDRLERPGALRTRDVGPGLSCLGRAGVDVSLKHPHQSHRYLAWTQKGSRLGLRDLVYRLYERRLEASLSGHSIPRHVGVILDGNRRWARSAGLADVSDGHQKGADHIFELLGWCRQAGVEVVTLWLLSTDNLAR